jgi:hypothetical protein
MLGSFELEKKQSDEIVSIAKLHFKQFNVIRMSMNGMIELYVNHNGHQGFSDYALPYDEYVTVHWFEFMTKTLIDEKVIPDYNSIEYVHDIFLNNTHPITAYKNYKD